MKRKRRTSIKKSKNTHKSGTKSKNVMAAIKTNLDDLITVEEVHREARRRLKKMVYDYYASGAEDQITLKRNVQYYQRIILKPRILVDVSNLNTKLKLSQRLGGQELDFPCIIAPTAMQCETCPEGEIATAKAAEKANTIMTLSSLSTTSLEKVAKATPNSPKWYQLYVLKNREFTARMVKRAEESGYTALVVTVDAPKLGNREADHHNRFHLSEGLTLKNLEQNELEEENENTSALSAYFKSLIDDSLTWQDITDLRKITKLPIIVKGIQCAEDAAIAVREGMDGIIVSNHGGRQQDTAIATVEVLPSVVKTVREDCKSDINIFVDGGIRRGSSIFKALALGADAVLIGRPNLWGLSVGGADGAYHVIQILKKEFELTMKLCGCPSIDAINSTFIHQPDQFSPYADARL